METTKDICWKMYQNIIIPIAKAGKKELSLYDLLDIIHQINGRYDNRTANNYIECLCDNNWLVQKHKNPLDILGKHVVNSIHKYRSVTFMINEDGKYEKSEDEIKCIINEIVNRKTILG